MNVHVRGMHGLGDNIHERALIRQLLDRGDTVYLETPWPSVFHDLAETNRLFFVSKTTRLRTQAKNAQREASKFTRRTVPAGAKAIRVWYPPTAVRNARSVLRAMLIEAGADPARSDFRMPIPDAWWSRTIASISYQAETSGKPILIYRPLVERTEWDCKARNPDVSAYRQLIQSIAEYFFVVSIADVVPGKEWIVDPVKVADIEFHKGELTFEEIATLTKRAALVFCSPGFMVPLSQAIGTPAAVVFGGYERAYSFSAGAAFTPYLGIEPIEPCDCFSHAHLCKKRIDLPAARDQLHEFIRGNNATRNHDQQSPASATPEVSPAIL